jgi:hypothetical protein
MLPSVTKRGERPLVWSPGDESRAAEHPSLISVFTRPCENRYVVLLHVGNQIAFRRVPQHRTAGKNTTMFASCAIRYISCFERELAGVDEQNEGCGTTHQRQFRSPRRGSRRESSQNTKSLLFQPGPFLRRISSRSFRCCLSIATRNGGSVMVRFPRGRAARLLSPRMNVGRDPAIW